MKVEKLINEAELRNLIRRRLLKSELTILNEQSGPIDLMTLITSLSSISAPSGSGAQLMTQANINILKSASDFLATYTKNPLLASTGVAALIGFMTGNPTLGIAGAAAFSSQVSSLRAWVNTKLIAAVQKAQSQNSANNSYVLRQPGYYKLAQEINSDIRSKTLSIPGIKEDASGETSFITDVGGTIIDGFLGIPFTDFEMDVTQPSVSVAALGANLSYHFENPPDNVADAIGALTTNAFEDPSVGLLDHEYINKYLFSRKSLFKPMDGEGTRPHNPDRYFITRTNFNDQCNPSKDASETEGFSVAYLLTAVMSDNGRFSTDPIFPNLAADLDANSDFNGLLGVIKSKETKKAFKISDTLPGYSSARASALLYDPNGDYHIEEEGYLFFGPKFLEKSALGVLEQKIKNLGSELLRLAKAAGVFLVDNYPDLLKDDEGEIQTQLDALKAVLDSDAGVMECTASVLKTLLIMLKVGGTKAFDKVVEVGEDIYDFFTVEDNNETITTTTSGTTTSATTRSTTAGTRSNTERIQTLLNQYWTKEGLTSPALLEVDGKWGDLTDFMWFAVLQHASDYNAWYNKTVTSDGEDSGSWPATAASLRDIDGEEFDGKTTGCIQFLEKLLDAETEAGTSSVNTPSDGGDAGDGSGTTTQQQSRGEATGMQGLIKVVGTGMTDVMYLEDIGYSEGTSESLARDIINAADRGYTGSGEPLNFTVEIFKNSNSGEYRRVKVKRAKGENRRDLSGLEKIPGVIKNFLEKKKPNFNDDNFQNTMRKEKRVTKIYEFNLAITVPG